MKFRYHSSLLIIFFFFISCNLKNTKSLVYLKIYSTSPDHFGVENYLLMNDTLFMNDNGYMTGKNKLIYKKLTSDQISKLNNLLNELFINGDEIDSSLFHPRFHLECYTFNNGINKKVMIFNDSISDTVTNLLDFLKQIQRQDFIELKGSHVSVRDVNFTSLIKINDTIPLSSIESFLIWFDLMSTNPIIIRSIPNIHNLYHIEAIYPIDSKNTDFDFYLSNKNIYVVLKNDSVFKYKLRFLKFN